VPAQGHVPGDLLARGQRASAAGRRAARRLPVVRGVGGASCSASSRAYVEAKQRAARARLRRPAALLGADDGRARAGRRDRRALRPRAGRRVPGHQPPAGRRSCSR
ncbi:MAG: hypothetical protein MZW92_23680, partial [Comamonadaceae bacterium]|nr:hypothetical protein [Comamonadaceae bacterium]